MPGMKKKAQFQESNVEIFGRKSIYEKDTACTCIPPTGNRGLNTIDYSVALLKAKETKKMNAKMLPVSKSGRFMRIVINNVYTQRHTYTVKLFTQSQKMGCLFEKKLILFW